MSVQRFGWCALWPSSRISANPDCNKKASEFEKRYLKKACGDLGINSKNSQPDIDLSAARYKMYKRVATHKAPGIHPVKNQKKEK